MHIMCTRGRPAGLKRYFEEGKPEQPGVVVIDDDQLEMYKDLQLPPGWHKIIAHRTMESELGPNLNLAFGAFPNEPWYMYDADDTVGRSPHWDTVLAEAVTPGTFVWPNDMRPGLSTAPGHTCWPSHPVVGGDLARALGWLAHPALKHMYLDNVWDDIQKALGIGTYLPHVLLEHMHYGYGKSKRDATYQEVKQRFTSEGIYKRIVRDELPGILEKLNVYRMA